MIETERTGIDAVLALAPGEDQSTDQDRDLVLVRKGKLRQLFLN